MWHFKEFYKSVSYLFTLFDIEPSVEFGKMSKEEFTALVEGSLKQQAFYANRFEGFSRLNYYNKFRQMHAEALKRRLCRESWEHYFPRKEKNEAKREAAA